MNVQEIKALQGALHNRMYEWLGDFRLPLAGLWLLAFAGGLACANGSFMEVFAPAGLAWAAAWGTAGVAYLPACLGLLVLWIARGLSDRIVPLIVLSGLLALRHCLPALSQRRWTGYAALALCGLIPLFGVRLPLEALLELWNLVLTLALYAAFCRVGQAVGEGVENFHSQDWVCAALSLGAILSGLPRAGLLDVAGCVASFVVLACARLKGAGASGAAGLACALVLCLSGAADPAYVCILGGAGLAAGSLFSLGLAAVGLGYAAALVSLDVLLTGALFSAVSWQALLLAEFAFFVIPGRLWKRWGRTALAPAAPAAARVETAEASARLARFAECFRELASIFEEGRCTGEDFEDAMPLLEHVAQQVCAQCTRRQICWKREFSRTASDLWQAARVQEEENRILWEEDFPADFAARCLQLPRVTEELRKICGASALRRKLREEVIRSRDLVGRQMAGVARVMEQLSSQMQWAPVPREDQVKVLSCRLKARGIPVHSLHVLRDASGRVRVRLVSDACAGDKRCEQEILPIVQQVMGVPMARQMGVCGGKGLRCRLSFVQARVLGIRSSALQWAVGSTCGDACIRLSLGERGYLLALSDGMGVGEAAAAESRRLLRLVEEFYRAGFEEEVIFTTINEMLLLRSDREMFATLDVCLVDLVHARAHFVKLGAAPSFVLRDGRPMMIAAASLPMGIVEEITPYSRSVDLLPGDVIVLGSDGIIGSGEEFGERLSRWANLPVERLARRAMEEAQDREDLRPDDRTLLAACITASHADRAEEYRKRRTLRWKARVC